MWIIPSPPPKWRAVSPCVKQICREAVHKDGTVRNLPFSHQHSCNIVTLLLATLRLLSQRCTLYTMRYTYSSVLWGRCFSHVRHLNRCTTSGSGGMLCGKCGGFITPLVSSSCHVSTPSVAKSLESIFRPPGSLKCSERSETRPCTLISWRHLSWVRVPERLQQHSLVRRDVRLSVMAQELWFPIGWWDVNLIQFLDSCDRVNGLFFVWYNQ
jgi:hypothetical protein